MTETPEYTDLLKVGTDLLIHRASNGARSIRHGMFQAIGSEAAEGNVAIVSSAAIAAGLMLTNTHERPDESTHMSVLQYMGGVGQRVIYNAWDDAIWNKNAVGILLTSNDLNDDATAEEAMGVTKAALDNNGVPIINENHAVAHKEIQFGGNDVLAARYAARMQGTGFFGQVRLHLLTDVNGFLKNIKNPDSRVEVIDNPEEYRHLIQDSHVDPRTGKRKDNIGGMTAKFDAIKEAQKAGVETWIYNPEDGHRRHAIAGRIGTYFPALAV